MELWIVVHKRLLISAPSCVRNAGKCTLFLLTQKPDGKTWSTGCIQRTIELSAFKLRQLRWRITRSLYLRHFDPICQTDSKYCGQTDLVPNLGIQVYTQMVKWPPTSPFSRSNCPKDILWSQLAPFADDLTICVSLKWSWVDLLAHCVLVYDDGGVAVMLPKKRKYAIPSSACSWVWPAHQRVCCRRWQICCSGGASILRVAWEGGNSCGNEAWSFSGCRVLRFKRRTTLCTTRGCTLPSELSTMS